jgi:hypothetical protein
MINVLALGLFASVPLSNSQIVPTQIYQGVRSIKEQKISLAGWGSGTISETEGIGYEGNKSIRVSTRNYFQGGNLVLGNPVDLAKSYDDKSDLLTLTFFLDDAGWVYGTTDKSADTKGSDVLKGRGGGPQRMTSTKNQLKVNGAPPPFKPKIKSLRMIITTTDEKHSEVYIPVDTSRSASDNFGWRSVSVPLQSINGLDRTNKIVKEVALSADTYATMYVGGLDVRNDQTPIEGRVNNVTKLNLALGDKVALTAQGNGGSSVLVYNWDFDSSDGLQIDAEGANVVHQFRQAGKFKVTLTISDLYGLKKPYVTTFPVTVNP